METTTQNSSCISPSSGPRIELVEHYAVAGENNSLFVKTATHSGLLSGRMVRDVLPKLLPMLDGSRSFEDIAQSMSALLTREQTSQVIQLLFKKGLIREAEAPPTELSDCDLKPYESMARYFGMRGSRYTTLSRLKTAHIGIVNTGPVAPTLVSSLAHFGVPKITVLGTPEIEALEIQQSRFYHSSDQNSERTSVWRERLLKANPHIEINVAPAHLEEAFDWEEMLQNLSMLVVLLQGPLLFPEWLHKLNEAAFALRVPWTSVTLLEGDLAQIGPTIRPGVTACYKCFEKRLKSNLALLGANGELDKYLREPHAHVDFGLLPPVADIVAGFTAIEIVRTLSPETVAHTSGKLMMLNLGDFTTEFHPVLKMPRCPVCSPVLNRPQPRVWS